MSLALLSFALLSCGGHRPGSARQAALGAAPPRLPAPEAPVYAIHLGEPADPLVARVVGDLPWEEALSGAAGAVGVAALGGEAAGGWAVRWAALRAGYPHPVVLVATEPTAEGAVGQAVLDALARGVAAGDHVGLARIRGGEGDLWVGMVGRPRVAFEAFPRALPAGSEFALRWSGGAPDGLGLVHVTPAGTLARRDLAPGDALSLPDPGEHWFELRDVRGVVAAFPVAVGIPPASVPPLHGVRRPASDDAGLVAAAWDLLAALGEEFGRTPPANDPILGPVAAAHLAYRLGDAATAPGSFAGAPGSCRASLACDLPVGAGAEACFERWLVEPEARAALLDARCTVAGLAAARRNDRLWLQLELGEE